MTVITPARITEDIERFLAFKRALGHPYQRAEFMLRSFERFVREHTARGGHVTLDEQVAQWLARRDGCKPVTITVELGVIRQFCLYRQRHDPGSFVPDRTWAPQATKSEFLPHVFSREEVKALLHTARTHPGPNAWGTMLHTLILVLYCTGLRPGEAVRLQLDDVDLRRNLFTVRESKGKTRIVPFRGDLAAELKRYLRARHRLNSEDDAFFVRLNGQPLSVHLVSYAIRQLLRRLGLKPLSGRVGPRPYDLRHAFAVHRLTEWYEQGVDIHARLPWLSAYMGHDNVLGTETYLHATPGLMSVASERFERRVRLARREQ